MTPITVLSDEELVEAIYRVSVVIEEEIERYRRLFPTRVNYSMRRAWGCNPAHSQTKQGLFPEYIYGNPSKVWTPWGYWSFGGITSWQGDADIDDINERTLLRLGATLYLEEKYTQMTGSHGPVYALHRVDELILPEPLTRRRDEYRLFAECGQAWTRLTAASGLYA